MFDEINNFFMQGLTNPNIYAFAKALLVFILGFIVLKIIVYLLNKRVSKKYSPQSSLVLKKIVFYLGITILLLLSLQIAGVKMSAILAGAGIAGIALGFAAQTSVSNIISGIFLLSEKPFEINDLIKVEGHLGIVHSIDLLSVKMRTLDNLFVRIPNETMLKANVLNITRYPIRRMNFDIKIAYKEDLRQVKEILLETANSNIYALDNPEPYFLIRDFEDSGISILLGIWFDKNDYTELKNSMMTAIHENFRKSSIEIPFPHISVYTGSDTMPFPVKDISEKK